MFLLILVVWMMFLGIKKPFTFHYVSINTEERRNLENQRDHLYIPLCFY